VTIAVLAVLVAAVVGAVAGAAAGVISAVGTLVSGALFQIALTGLANNAASATRLGQTNRIYALPTVILEGGVTQFLRAEAEIVPFWPRAELKELTSWLASSHHVSIRLVTGEGGTGKTRLALQLAETASENGWHVRWVRAGTEQAAARTARNVGGPALLVVDYAETRIGLPGLLADVARHASGPDIRVLLLARSAGDWWQQLINGSEYQLSELLAAVPQLTLGPVSGTSGQSEVFDAALAAFAAVLGLPRPAAQMRLGHPGAVVLVVHAAALVAVLDQTSGGSPAGASHTVGDALAGLLRHEARYWEQSQASRDLGLDPELQRRAVAIGCLVGADSESAARKLLAVVPDLADSAERRARAARWLRDLYPVAQSGPVHDEWLGSLQPDLIEEHLVVEVLSQQPGLVGDLFTGLTGKRAKRALTVLARAALTDPAAWHQLDAALASNLEYLAVPALRVAVETNVAVAELVRNAVISRAVQLTF
jgi:hypothetical protein